MWLAPELVAWLAEGSAGGSKITIETEKNNVAFVAIVNKIFRCQHYIFLLLCNVCQKMAQLHFEFETKFNVTANTNFARAFVESSEPVE